MLVINMRYVSKKVINMRSSINVVKSYSKGSFALD